MGRSSSAATSGGKTAPGELTNMTSAASRPAAGRTAIAPRLALSAATRGWGLSPSLLAVLQQPLGDDGVDAGGDRVAVLVDEVKPRAATHTKGALVLR